jgi:hypothetical protein
VSNARHRYPSRLRQPGQKPSFLNDASHTIIIVCGREHLDGFKRYAELADAIKGWLEETRR